MTVSEEISRVRFTPVRFSEGYDMDEVDRFLDRTAAAADAATDAQAMQEVCEAVAAVRFTPVRMSEGYDMDEVDLFLDGPLTELLAEHAEDVEASAGPVPCAEIAAMLTAPGLTAVRLGARYDRAGVDELITRAADALTGPGDEADRRRAALRVLETPTVVPARGLAIGYEAAGVDQRLRRVLTRLRRS